MQLILFDDAGRERLLPLTFTRPVCEVRIGIQTIREKWESSLNAVSSTCTVDYLQAKYPLEKAGQNLWINGAACVSDELLDEVHALPEGTWLVAEARPVAYRSSDEEVATIARQVGDPNWKPTASKESKASFTWVEYPWDIFAHNGTELQRDFERITRGRTSAPLSDTNRILGEQVFAEPGASAECAILNAQTGPIYLGAASEIMEGSVVRGGLAMLDHAVLKLATKIYGPTTIGPYCKVGGEVNNSVLFGYSNKGHDGFLGNSILGEWCNLGADTNTSNLKNNYGEVRAWSYADQQLMPTGRQFLGLIMGDHGKSGINTMFNTGTVVGVSANVYGGGFPPKHIPSFSWGGAEGLQTFRLEKAFEVADRMMQRRGKACDATERAILEHVFEQTRTDRQA